MRVQQIMKLEPVLETDGGWGTKFYYKIFCFIYKVKTKDNFKMIEPQVGLENKLPISTALVS